MAATDFDPRAILAALEREYVAYVLIGGLARILRGADETTNGLDICPSLRASNLPRLQRALEDLAATPAACRRKTLDLAQLNQQPVVSLATRAGDLQLVAAPAGTRNGYDDLRAAPPANTSAKASDPPSRPPPTSPARPPPSAATKTFNGSRSSAG